jgi:hypothetical protein
MTVFSLRLDIAVEGHRCAKIVSASVVSVFKA